MWQRCVVDLGLDLGFFIVFFAGNLIRSSYRKRERGAIFDEFFV